MRRLLAAIGRKLVQGLTTALSAVGVATLAVSVLDGQLQWFGTDAALRVGLPAFAVGLLFFPVNEKTLGRRWGFAMRAAVAAAVSGAVHRVLLWSYVSTAGQPLPDGFAETLQVRLASVIDVLRHPAVLLPTGDLDATMFLALGAVAGAAVVGFLAQPPLLRLARGRRGSAAVPSASGSLDATGREALRSEALRTR